MRGILVINPKATTASRFTTDVLVQALSHELDLTVVRTEYRGHAKELARASAERGEEFLVTVGGDGLVHECVNGLLDHGVPHAKVPPSLIPLPGGSANVFSRTLGYSPDPAEAAGQALESVRSGLHDVIGLGHLRISHVAETPTQETWMVINAGLGLDAQIIASMEQQRELGERATPTRYLFTTVREYLAATTSSDPTLAVGRAGENPIAGVYVVIVQNTSPWTYFGPFPIDPSPYTDPNLGLDLFALRALGPWSTARAARRMVLRVPGRRDSKTMISWHDQQQMWARSSTGAPLQVDGEGYGVVREVLFRKVPRALHVIPAVENG